MSARSVRSGVDISHSQLSPTGRELCRDNTPFIRSEPSKPREVENTRYSEARGPDQHSLPSHGDVGATNDDKDLYIPSLLPEHVAPAYSHRGPWTVVDRRTQCDYQLKVTGRRGRPGDAARTVTSNESFEVVRRLEPRIKSGTGDSVQVDGDEEGLFDNGLSPGIEQDPSQSQAPISKIAPMMSHDRQKESGYLQMEKEMSGRARRVASRDIGNEGLLLEIESRKIPTRNAEIEFSQTWWNESSPKLMPLFSPTFSTVSDKTETSKIPEDWERAFLEGFLR